MSYKELDLGPDFGQGGDVNRDEALEMVVALTAKNRQLRQQLAEAQSELTKAQDRAEQAAVEASEYHKILEQWVEKIEWKFRDDGSKNYKAFVHELLTREKAAEEATRKVLASTTLAEEHLRTDETIRAAAQGMDRGAIST